MDRIKDYELKFLRHHGRILLIIIIYAFYSYFDNKETALPLLVVGSLILIAAIRFASIKFTHANKKNIHLGLSMMYLTIFSTISFNQNVFIQNIGILLYLITFIEIILVYEPDSPSENQLILIAGFFPLVIGTIILMNTRSIDLKTFVYIILLFFTIFSILYCVSYYVSEQKRAHEKLHKEIKANKFEKESLQLEKYKYKQLHNLVSSQKYEIEQKNVFLNRISAEMYTQSELLRYISSVLNIQELIGLVTDAIIGAIGVDTCMLVIYDRDSATQYYKVNSNSGNDSVDGFKADIANGYYESYFFSIKPFMDSNVDIAKYPFIHDREVGSLIIVPLFKGDVVYGLLIAEHHAIEMFDSNSLNFFKSIMSQINIAVDNANIYKKMEEMAIRDGLTGLYNRKHMQKLISEVIEQITTYKVVSLALFDIDKFKKFNDTYGHLFGDEVIKALAKVANTYALQYDGIAGRYGGEEFVLALPGKSLEEAEPIIQAFHKDIQAIRLKYNQTEDVTFNISIGLSVAPELAVDAEELLRRADNAMYYAKNNGRGQIIVDYKDFDKII